MYCITILGLYALFNHSTCVYGLQPMSGLPNAYWLTASWLIICWRRNTSSTMNCTMAVWYGRHPPRSDGRHQMLAAADIYGMTPGLLSVDACNLYCLLNRSHGVRSMIFGWRRITKHVVPCMELHCVWDFIRLSKHQWVSKSKVYLLLVDIKPSAPK